MSDLEFFKKQAKNFLKDWKTRKLSATEFGFKHYEYDSKFFDVGSLIHLSYEIKTNPLKILTDLIKSGYDFDKYIEIETNALKPVVEATTQLSETADEDDFSLMKAQHLIAKMVGFKSWKELISASEKELLLAEILLRHFYDNDDIYDWKNALIFVGKEDADIDEKIEFARLYYDDWKTGERFGAEIATPNLSEEKMHEIDLAIARPNFEGLKLTSPVVCPDCFQEFYFREATVAVDSDTDELFVCCKNPGCNCGAYSFIYDTSVESGRPFDSDMDSGYVDDFE